MNNALRNLVTAVLLCAPVIAWSAPAAPDSAAIADVTAAFHAALAAGDSVGALALLADDVVVLEGGDLETRADYVAHHLGADIAFAQAMSEVRTVSGVRQEGDAAWLWATSESRGNWHGNLVDSIGAEMMVLARDEGVWRIRAIHWSSHRRRP